jgi:hypothetical protein
VVVDREVVDREGEMRTEVVVVDRDWEVIIPAVDGGVVTTRPVVEAVVEVAATRQVRREYNVHVVGLTLETD